MSSQKVPSDSNRDITTEAIKRYSVFTKAERWCIVALASYAAWFSTLSSFIYFPAIPTLSQEIGVSVNTIDLTVTTYMAVATFSPMLVADAAEILGRRPVYAVTLSVFHRESCYRFVENISRASCSSRIAGFGHFWYVLSQSLSLLLTAVRHVLDSIRSCR